MSIKWQVFIRWSNAKTSTINDVDKDTTIKTLFQKIKDKENAEINELRLIYGGKQIATEPESKLSLKLSDYGIHKESTLTAVGRLIGGAAKLQPESKKPDNRDNYEFDEEKINELGAVKVGNECITIRIEKGTCACCTCDDMKLAVIHGNHKICAICMANWCRAKILNGEKCIKIKCPFSSGASGDECDIFLPHPVAFTIAGFNKKEWDAYQWQLDMNSCGFKACPNVNCGKYLAKETKEVKVKCPYCKAFDFCWKCLMQWKGEGTSICGNDSCDFVDGIKTIEKAWNERGNFTLAGVQGVPKIRICPNTECQALNGHKEGCKRIFCGRNMPVGAGCKHQYCHICLNAWENCPCGYCQVFGSKLAKCGYNTTCKVANMQAV